MSSLVHPNLEELPDRADVVVVGAGLTGAAAAWAGTRRDLSVVVLEQFTIGHAHGSSHGSARIVRRAYPDELYVGLTGRAFELWQELEASAAMPILTMTGGIDHGDRRDPERIAEIFSRAGVRHALLGAGEAESRWPGMRFDGPVLFHPQAGVMDADRAIQAFVGQAKAGGALVFENASMLDAQLDPGGVIVQTSIGTVTARRLVLAAGGWLAGLAESLTGTRLRLPRLSVTQQQAFHFERSEPDVEWPITVHKLASGAGLQAYHLPGGRDGGPDHDRKISEHCGTTGPTTPLTRDGLIDPTVRERVTSYVREWLPGLVPLPRREVSCLYTSTDNEDFLLDIVDNRIVIASPCSGHGAKFAPVLGEIITGLVTGEARPDPRFSLAGHLAWTS
ncbi:FAD-dependent oxidoreductase [Jatrophihabitans telluris]|uniref:FAD-dependent oxidoreductase n=1 Tax=Jatrophihabitans telluris TaxID=2038343 RepID=A0ABY4QVV2_9ACTN|nr:FAD-dependent oxidoreductase [Jatrophihabitans telluris]UQX87463.1 FAD-dependent oxidoreductase [Jatrophihabitans telluris]